MNKNNFLVRHYDDTISLHSDLHSAMVEAKQRLEPWRDASDRVAHQIDATPRTGINRVIVVNSVGEPTDAESYISPCGEWIHVRECLPKANQRILVHWLDFVKNQMRTDVFDSRFVEQRIKDGAIPDHVWWRPLPPFPAECEGATQC